MKSYHRIKAWWFEWKEGGCILFHSDPSSKNMAIYYLEDFMSCMNRMIEQWYLLFIFWSNEINNLKVWNGGCTTYDFLYRSACKQHVVRFKRSSSKSVKDTVVSYCSSRIKLCSVALQFFNRVFIQYWGCRLLQKEQVQWLGDWNISKLWITLPEANSCRHLGIESWKARWLVCEEHIESPIMTIWIGY
jgi:hypothetical protein